MESADVDDAITPWGVMIPQCRGQSVVAKPIT
jgi:hypothetical protein